MTREPRPVLLGVLLCVAIIAVWWSTTHDFAPSSASEGTAIASGDSETGEDADSGPAGIAPREVSPASGGAAESDAEDVGELLLDPPPDTPPEPPNIRPEFGALLLRAAEVNGTGTPEQACLAWSHLLTLGLAAEASEAERSVAFLNVADACARSNATPRTSHDLRLAHESIIRLAQDDPSNQKQLDEFRAKHPELTNTRAALVIVDQHPEGTLVTLDEERVGSEPCTLAVPVDGELHRIGFSGPDGEASLLWSPSTPDSTPPPMPELVARK